MGILVDPSGSRGELGDQVDQRMNRHQTNKMILSSSVGRNANDDIILYILIVLTDVKCFLL